MPYITPLLHYATIRSCQLEYWQVGQYQTRCLQLHSVAIPPWVRVRDEMKVFIRSYRIGKWVCSFCWSELVRERGRARFGRLFALGCVGGDFMFLSRNAYLVEVNAGCQLPVMLIVPPSIFRLQECRLGCDL